MGSARSVLIVALACAGCGGSGAVDGGPLCSHVDAGAPVDASFPPVSLADGERQLEQAFCVQAVRCGGIGASEELQCEEQALATLAALHVSSAVDVDYAQLDDAVANGRLSYDGAIAAACIDAVRYWVCDPWSAIACLRAFHGEVAIGGACRGNLECAGGAHCVPTDGT